MKSTIILAPGANGAEMLRSLAKLKINTIGCRVVNAEELARIALMHSGIVVDEEYVTKEEMASMIFSTLMDQVGYFENSKTYEDAVQVANAISILRNMSYAKTEDEEMAQLRDALLKETDFPEKNKALLEIYEEYSEKCKSDNKTDATGIVRRALKEASPIQNIDFIILKEYPLTVLEAALISCVSGDTYQVKEMRELFGAEKQPVMIHSYTRAYGIINEVEGIISRIYSENDTKPDEWLIACGNPKEFAQVFYDVAGRYDVPISFGTGISITNSKPAELLYLILDWNTKGHHGIAALKKILNSDAFDSVEFATALGFDENKEYYKYKEFIIKIAGGLRLSFNDEENRKRITSYQTVLQKEFERMSKLPDSREKKNVEKRLSAIKYVEKFSDELALGEIYFLNKYCRLRSNNDYVRNIDKSAKTAIVDAFRDFKINAPDRDVFEIAPHILSSNVYRESAKEGHIHITSIGKAITEQRKKLWVCGLSADAFPGSPRENYLLLDRDLEVFSAKGADLSKEIAVRQYMSESLIEQRKTSLNDLVNLASDLGTEINLSYNSFDVTQLERKNPSSMLFNYYKMERPDADLKSFMKDFESGGALESVGFFDAPLSESRLFGKSFLDDCIISDNPDEKDAFDGYNADELLERAWSPSSLNKFFECPRRFYLNNIMGIPDEQEDDTYRLTEGPAAGLLAHHLLEDLAAEGVANITRKEFIERAAAAMSDYFLGRIPLSEKAAKLEIDNFTKMMADAYDKEIELGREVVASEAGIGTETADKEGILHESGIRLKGFPDRVEKDSKGNLIVADIKTERKESHIEDDIDSCLQVVIYAWLYETSQNATIHHCEYRNLRTRGTVSCKYDEEMKGALDERLREFKWAIEECIYERNPGEDEKNCRYCTFGSICDNPNWTMAIRETADESGEEENE